MVDTGAYLICLVHVTDICKSEAAAVLTTGKPLQPRFSRRAIFSTISMYAPDQNVTRVPVRDDTSPEPPFVPVPRRVILHHLCRLRVAVALPAARGLRKMQKG